MTAVWTRESLRWLPAPPSESCDVLSLSFGDSGYFLDLRVVVEEGHKRKGQVDWAVAGTTEETSDSSAELIKIRFTPLFDSRFSALPSSSRPSATPSTEEGHFSPISARPGFLLEAGSMKNHDLPGSPVLPFEEVWRDHELEEGVAVLLLEKVVGEGEKKAFVGRIGGWGIGLKDGGGEGEEEFLAVSWERVGGEWRERQVVGGEKARRELPRVPEEGVTAEVGEVVRLGESEWKVLEKSGKFA